MIPEDLLGNLRLKLSSFRTRSHFIRRKRPVGGGGGDASVLGSPDAGDARGRSGSSVSHHEGSFLSHPSASSVSLQAPARHLSSTGSFDSGSGVGGELLLGPNTGSFGRGIGGESGAFAPRARSGGSDVSSFSGSGSFAFDAAGHLVMESGVPGAHISPYAAHGVGGEPVGEPRRYLKPAPVMVCDPLDPHVNLCKGWTHTDALKAKEMFHIGAENIQVWRGLRSFSGCCVCMCACVCMKDAGAAECAVFVCFLSPVPAAV